MGLTNLADVTAQIQKFWAPVFTKELRESLLLGSLVERKYSGDIKNQGNSVTISQVNSPTGQLLTVGTNADVFDSEVVSMSHIHLTADKRAVAAYEIHDLAKLQSQLDSQDSELMDSLKYAVGKQINDYLYTLVNPSTATPDHLVSGNTDCNAATLSALRLLASVAKWPTNNRYGLLDPSYMSDVMDDTTLSSSLYGASDAPMISGQVGLSRFGFKLFEDNSRSTDTAIFFIPEWLNMVMQPEVTVKLSDLHSAKKFGYLLSVDIVFGAALGINGNVKHIKLYNS